MTSYTPNIPLPTDNLSDSQAQILGNFQQLQTSFSVDHVPLTTPANNGYHTQVSFALNQSAPGLGTGVGELYSNSAQGRAWPFWQNTLGSFQLAGASAATLATNGYVISSGLLIQWGRVTGLSGAWPAASVVSLATLPNISFTTPFGVFITMIGPTPTTSAARDVYINSFSGSAFQWGYSGPSNSTNDGFYWVAIGTK